MTQDQMDCCQPHLYTEDGSGGAIIDGPRHGVCVSTIRLGSAIETWQGKYLYLAPMCVPLY